MTRTALRALFLALIATLVSEALWAMGLLSGIEAGLTDTWHDLRGQRDDMEVPVILIAVDDETLDRLPDPFVFWGPHFAKSFETLRAHGTTVIGLDFLNKVSGEDFFQGHGLQDLPIGRSWDASFRKNLFQHDIVLSAFRTGDGAGSDTIELPIGEYIMMIGSARARIGLDNLPHDGDGVVRRWRPVVASEYVNEPKAPMLSLSLALAIQHNALDATDAGWNISGRQIPVSDELHHIVYRGPAGTWPRIPMWKLLEEGALTETERASLDGAIVIVGVTHTGSTDRLRSPFSNTLMAGAEVHANALGTLISGLRLRQLSPMMRAALTLVLSWFAALGFLLVEARSGGVVVVISTITVPAVGYLAFAYGDVLLPSATVAITIILVYAGAFTARYLGEEREKRHLRKVFSRYVSDAVVNDILSSPDGLKLGGERRYITVLFSDIRNFTTISEALEPEEVVEMLNMYFALACKPVLDNGGVVDKFIGDAVMAVFGAPVHSEHHPDQAIIAALEMSKAADGFRAWMTERFGDRNLPPFDVGIGIHTGFAIVGNIGFEKRTEYTVIGDAVNVAARLEGLTKAMGCRLLVSKETLTAATAKYTTGKVADMKVKGREVAVGVIEITGREAS